MSQADPPTTAPRATPLVLRAARVRDVGAIRALVEPYVATRAIVSKPPVAYFESLQEFVVAESGSEVLGCGALHVIWENVAEVRTIAVHPSMKGRGVGHLMLGNLIAHARELGVSRVFCLTFEVDFFARHGFVEIDGDPVDPAVYLELLQSYDEGVAEFLDLDRVKPNTLGNTRMLLTL